MHGAFVVSAVNKTWHALQEPELLEQIYLGMGTYDGVGHMRLCSAMRKANRINRGAEAGSSSSSSHAGLISDNTEVVQLLVRASEQYSQAGAQYFNHTAAVTIVVNACKLSPVVIT